MKVFNFVSWVIYPEVDILHFSATEMETPSYNGPCKWEKTHRLDLIFWADFILWTHTHMKICIHIGETQTQRKEKQIAPANIAQRHTWNQTDTKAETE